MKRTTIKFVSVFIFLFCCILLAGCDSGNQGDITSTLKLTKDYVGKNFITDGIGEATLTTKTDGDTSGFTLKNGTYVTIRYYGVDTPESTKEYEKWGKSASNFTSGTLENASQIVLEATTTPASVDTYGTRYLGYVWYRNSEDEEFRNLNLEVVENGYSVNKITDRTSPYYSYFVSAQERAKANAIHIWSSNDTVDPYYSEEILDVTMKEIVTNTEEIYNTYKFVRFEAYIKSINGSYFTVGNVVDGQEYTMTVYNSLYESVPYFLEGNLIRFVGRVLTYNNNYQITALEYKTFGGGDDKCQLVTSGYFITFNKSGGYSLGAITVSNATVADEVLTIVGTTTYAGVDINVTLTYNLVGGETVDASQYIGKTLSVSAAYCESGYTKNDSTLEAKIYSLSTLIVK